VIGEIFDQVWREGGSKVSNNVQTTMIPAGGATIAEFKLDVPGTYVLVDHSIFRAFNKGALGLLEAVGDPDENTYSGLELDEVYLGDYSPKSSELHEEAEAEEAQGDSLQARILRGEAVYQGTCSTCHMNDGAGMEGVFPPLAESDYLMDDKERSIHLVLAGLQGPITVNGKEYDSVMPAFNNLNDREIASVLTYIRNSFGNDGDAVTPDEVAEVRADLPEKEAPSGHP
jgi:nitrite reductase (NO-forming)